MNCQLFEKNVTNLVRDTVPVDAAARASALAHAAECARCRARLADERALTIGLSTAVDGWGDAAQPPARVETALLTAFRRARPAGAAFDYTPPRLQLISSKRLGLRLSRAPGAAAAAATAAAAVVIVAMILAAGLRPIRLPHTEQNGNNQARPEMAAVRREQPPEVIKPAKREEPRPDVTLAVEQTTPVSRPSSRVASVRIGARSVKPGPPTGAAAPPSPRRTQTAVRNNKTPRGAAAAPDTSSLAADATLSTEFLPLMQGDSLRAEDGGQIVRVELPRAALVSFGLPMNLERSGERVTADVLLGHDGMARAIRFVR